MNLLEKVRRGQEGKKEREHALTPTGEIERDVYIWLPKPRVRKGVFSFRYPGSGW